jgi:hypothetical protein
MSTMNVRYLIGRWVTNRRAPAPGSQWIDAEQARARYEAGEKFLVLDAERVDDSGRPHPQWIISFGTGVPSAVRVQFYDRHGRLWNLVDYEPIQGRLWRSTTVSYVYRDDEKFYMQSDSTQIEHLTVKPDGTGFTEFRNKVEGWTERADIKDATVDACWLDRPQFGDWANLSDPYFGVPGLTGSGPTHLAG